MLLLNLQEHFFFFFGDYWFLMVSSPYSCVLGMAALKMIMRDSRFNLLLPEIFLFPTRPIDLLACIACFSSAIHPILKQVIHICKIRQFLSRWIITLEHLNTWTSVVTLVSLHAPPAPTWSNFSGTIQQKSLPLWRMTDDGLFSFAVIWPFFRCLLILYVSSFAT